MEFSKEDSLKCKGFAILIMLFHHMYMSPERYEGYVISFAPLSEEMVNQIADFLKICVGLYVFVSAFGLTVSYKNWKGRLSAFSLHRTFKMMFVFYVVYVCAVLVSFVVAKDWNIWAVYGGKGRLAALFYMGIDFLGLADLFGTPSLNVTWWYMSFAIVLVFLVPVLNRLYDKVNGVWLLVMSVLLPKALGLSAGSHVIRYLPLLILGILCARTGLIGKCKEVLDRKGRGKKAIYFLVLLFFYVLLFRLREGVLKSSFIAVWDSVVPFLTVCLLSLFINRIRVLSHILSFFGTYSTLIFLTHTFIRAYWYPDFIYGHTSAWLNYGILVVTSLLVAVILDVLMKAIRVRKIENMLDKKLVAFMERERHSGF